MSTNDSTPLILRSELGKLGAREFEIVALTMDADRGLAALNVAIERGADHPISYAIKLFDDDDWNPAGEVRRRATNVSVTVECKTCGGDRFVIVGRRPVVASMWMREHKIEPPKGASIEEYAPCPDCNASTDTSFRRHDGTIARALDPAKVRELMDK